MFPGWNVVEILRGLFSLRHMADHLLCGCDMRNSGVICILSLMRHFSWEFFVAFLLLFIFAVFLCLTLFVAEPPHLDLFLYLHPPPSLVRHILLHYQNSSQS